MRRLLGSREQLRSPTARALFGTFLGYLPGFILPFAIAARMHIGGLTDAYSYALGIATFAAGLFTGVLQTNILPVLQHAKRFGRAYFHQRLRQITWQATVIVTVMYVVVGAAAVIYIDAHAHWSATQEQLVLGATILFGLFVIASSINSMIAAAINALGGFFRPAASQALRSLLPLILVPFVPRDASGFLIIGAVMAGGEFVRTLTLMRDLNRRGAVVPASSERAPEVDMSFWRVAAPSALALVVAAASPLVDRAVAAPLAPGSVTVIDLGERVFQVPLTVLAASLILVAGTHWAELGRSDIPALRAHVRRTMGRGVVVSVALTVLVLLAVGACALVVGPRFAGTSTARFLGVVSFLMAGLPAAYIIYAGARFLTATRTTYLLPGFAVISFSTNLVFDLIGAQLLGVEGIALSSTIYRCVNAVLYLLVVHRLLATRFTGLRLGRPTFMTIRPRQRDA